MRYLLYQLKITTNTDRQVTQAIQAHYGEMHIRRRMTDFISRFVRVAAYYEYRYRGTSKAGYPCTPFGEYLGQGTTFVDEAKKQKEMVANQPRIEAWRRTKGYKLHVKVSADGITLRVAALTSRTGPRRSQRGSCRSISIIKSLDYGMGRL